MNTVVIPVPVPAVATYAALPPGHYTIFHMESRLQLSGNGPDANPVVLGIARALTSQLWIINPALEKDYHEIKCKATNQSISVEEAKEDATLGFEQPVSSKWLFESVGNNTYYIVQLATSDLDGPVKLYLKPAKTRQNGAVTLSTAPEEWHVFKIDPMPAPKPSPLPGGHYTFFHYPSGLSLDEGLTLRQFTGAPTQMWDLQPTLKPDVYLWRSCSSGENVVHPSAPSEGNWKLEPFSSHLYHLILPKNGAPGRYLTPVKDEEEASTILSDYPSGVWHISYVDGPVAPPS